MHLIKEITMPRRLIRYALTLASTLTAAAVIALTGCSSAQIVSAPQRITLDARTNGIAIRPADGTIFITDDKTNSVLSSADGKAFKPFAAIPVLADQGNALSQVSIADG